MHKKESGLKLRLEEFNRAADLRLYAAQCVHKRRFTGISGRYRDGLVGIEVDIVTVEYGAFRCLLFRAPGNLPVELY